MRIRLNFIGNDDIPKLFKRVIFPVKKDVELIKDLKNIIIEFMRSLTRSKISIDSVDLKIQNFLLMDSFQVNKIIKNDDVVM
jgi:hypothetical protein